MKKEWYAKKWITILIHALAWILLFSLPYLLRPSYNPNDGRPPQPGNPNATFIVTILGEIIMVIFFYINAGLLMPGLLYKKIYAIRCNNYFFICLLRITGRLIKKKIY